MTKPNEPTRGPVAYVTLRAHQRAGRRAKAWQAVVMVDGHEQTIRGPTEAATNALARRLVDAAKPPGVMAESVEAAARAMCTVDGQNPDEEVLATGDGSDPRSTYCKAWEAWEDYATAALLATRATERAELMESGHPLADDYL